MCDLADMPHPFGKDWPISLIEPGRTDYVACFDPFKGHEDIGTAVERSEERRVGKEC